MRRHDLALPLPDDDLCLRAARALQQASGTALGADIHIHKRVPAAAGLGGGSSDAATTLLALNRLWDLHWPQDRLSALALTLGADVPFFVRGHNAFVQGVGEQVTPIELPRLWLAVVKPRRIAGDRGDLRPARRSSARPRPVILADFLADTQLSDCANDGYGRNDLQAVAQASMRRGGPGGPVVAGAFRQQPHVGVGQRSVRESRHRRPTVGDMGQR